MNNHRTYTPQFDVIIWGASSYMGQLVAEHFYETYGINKGLRWAIAGRNEQKLKSIRERLGSRAEQVPIFIAESHDRILLDAMVNRTRVICSTVGPYQLYGEALVASCIELGTDYCDLTGEYIWIREMIDKYELKARENNVRIINSCGFDSLPSDLGTLFVQAEMKQRYGIYANEVKMRVTKGFETVKYSGGTVASILTAFDLISRDKRLLKLAFDPNGLVPRDETGQVADTDIKYPKYDRGINAWVAPYLLGPGNTKIVRRGNALMGNRYGRDFRYGEGLATGPGLKGWWRALRATFGLYTLMLMLSIGFTRARLSRKSPKPGEGMNKQERDSKSYRIVLTASHPDDKNKFVQAEIRGKRDIGYGSSSRMVGEAAACLALDESVRARPGGFWTPASCMGERLIERLQTNADIEFTVLPSQTY